MLPVLGGTVTEGKGLSIGYFAQLPAIASPAKAFFTNGVESASEPARNAHGR